MVNDRNEEETLSQYWTKIRSKPNKHRTSQNVQDSGTVNFREQTRRWQQWGDWWKGYVRTGYTSVSVSATPKAACWLSEESQAAALRTGLPGTVKDKRYSFSEILLWSRLPKTQWLKRANINSHDLLYWQGSFWSRLGGVAWPHTPGPTLSLICQESSLGLFTWWQNGFSSKKGQAQHKSTFQASLTYQANEINKGNIYSTLEKQYNGHVRKSNHSTLHRSAVIWMVTILWTLSKAAPKCNSTGRLGESVCELWDQGGKR